MKVDGRAASRSGPIPPSYLHSNTQGWAVGEETPPPARPQSSLARSRTPTSRKGRKELALRPTGLHAFSRM